MFSGMARLSKNDWIEYGLLILKKDGFTSLKADVLAKGLRVSRGSFYWHFKDVSAFHHDVFAFWEMQSVQLAESLSIEEDPRHSLRTLVTAACRSDHRIERSMRAWGQSEKLVGERIDRLDAFRIDALTRVLSKMNLDQAETIRRAKSLYASAVGLSQIAPKHIQLSAEDIDALVELFLS